MKVLNMIFTLIFMGILCTIYKVYCVVTKHDDNTSYVPFSTYVKENGNKIYYVVEKYKSTDNNLVQKLSFYLPMKNEFRNVSLDVFAECGQPDFGKITFKNNLYWEVKDFDIVQLIQELQKSLPEVQLMRIDKDIVEC